MSEQSRGLAVRTITPGDLDVADRLAPIFYQSRLFGVSSKDQALVIALKGFELGLGFTASYEYINVIEGKPSLSPRGALAIALNSGEIAGWKIEERNNAAGEPWSCYVWMRRRNGLEYAHEFTLADALRANLVKPNSAWEKWPKSMLKWRCIGFVLDTLVPDVTGGMRRADEFGAAVDTEGNVVEAWTQPAPESSAIPASSNGADAASMPPAETITLQDLVDKFGAEAVMIAAGGRIPGTPDEVMTISAVLHHAATLASEGK